ncbi:MAG: peptidoglycan-N-acetylglucosamine deacetylase [Thermoleophilaceae bacterium]|nr:peptidoglycan-N-acetylglucosamine deacetylase [Thermoleophilaceae bacterium]
MTSSEQSVAAEAVHRRSSALIGVIAVLGAALAVALTAPGPTAPERLKGTALAATHSKGPGSDHFEPIQCEPRGATVRRGLTTKRKVVALTFDDGPSDLTNRFIRTLEEFHAHATFFVVGRNIPGREQMLRRAMRAQNTVGNHTYDHADVAAGGAAAVAQIEPTSKLIENATGVQPCLFRPPYGSRSSALDQLVKRERMMEVLWNVETADYEGGPAVNTEERAIEGIDRGNIILMHDGGGDEATTLAALPAILRAIKKRGFKTVTIPALFRLELKPGETPKPPDPNPLPEPKKPKPKQQKKPKAGEKGAPNKTRRGRKPKAEAKRSRRG